MFQGIDIRNCCFFFCFFFEVAFSFVILLISVSVCTDWSPCGWGLPIWIKTPEFALGVVELKNCRIYSLGSIVWFKFLQKILSTNQKENKREKVSDDYYFTTSKKTTYFNLYKDFTDSQHGWPCCFLCRIVFCSNVDLSSVSVTSVITAANKQTQGFKFT